MIDTKNILKRESIDKILLVFLLQFSVLTLFLYEQNCFPEFSSDGSLKLAFEVLAKKKLSKVWK